MKRVKRTMFFLLALLLIVSSTGFFTISQAAAQAEQSIFIQLDKTTAEVGEIIKASLKIEVANLTGYHVNIKYDPTVLEASLPPEYILLSNVMPIDGVLPKKPIDKVNGIINFGEIFEYPPQPADNVYKIISFKVLKKAPTVVRFWDDENMPDSIRGTYLFSLGTNPLTDYTVNQPPVINDTGCKVIGVVKPDVAGITDFSGFKVELEGTSFSAITDSNGKFEINGLSLFYSELHTVKVSKAGYLSRERVNINTDLNITQLGTTEDPLIMWPGDIRINGVQDGAINFVDIMEVARGFNSLKGNSAYNAEFDFNMDNAINLTDIMIVAKHFNACKSSYPLAGIITSSN